MSDNRPSNRKTHRDERTTELFKAADEAIQVLRLLCEQLCKETLCEKGLKGDIKEYASS